METHPILEFILFGLTWRYLQDAKEGIHIWGEGKILDNLDRLLIGLDTFDLVVTKRAANNIIAFRDEVKLRDTSAVLSKEDATKLQNSLGELQRTLKAEGIGHVAFVTTDKRIDVDKLISQVGALFPPKIFDSLPDVAKYDFIEAGKCIAFERSTAAAFHILRATEDVLRKLYCALVKRDRIDPLLWGPMVAHLRKRRATPPQVLLENLDNIRRSFRNPTQHPDKIYDIQEVQDLFPLCVDVITRMVKLLPSNSSSAA